MPMYCPKTKIQKIMTSMTLTRERKTMQTGVAVDENEKKSAFPACVKF
jgi:hypothetical protein